MKNGVLESQQSDPRRRSGRQAESLVRELIQELTRPGYFGTRVVEFKSQDGVITTAHVQSQVTHKFT